MSEETIEVAPSAENGNVPLEETPVDTSVETPSEPVEQTPTDELELFELPDGRKVDAQTLSREWKENFYPEYTRKSQALASQTKTEPTPNPLQDPEYVPQTYEELAAQIEARLEAKAQERALAEAQQMQNLETEINNQLTDLKTADPTLNENALFVHATKYGFKDLKLAHQNMKDMATMAQKVQKTTADNIQKRADPVSVTTGNSGGTAPNPSHFASAVDYMRSLKQS